MAYSAYLDVGLVDDKESKFITIVDEDGEQLGTISEDSKFYKYIGEIINAQNALNTAQTIIYNKNSGLVEDNIEEVNMIDELKQKIADVLSIRIEQYLNLKNNKLLFYNLIEKGEFGDGFELGLEKSETLRNQLELLQEYASDDNPAIVMAKIDDVEQEISFAERTTDLFAEQLELYIEGYKIHNRTIRPSVPLKLQQPHHNTDEKREVHYSNSKKRPIFQVERTNPFNDLMSSKSINSTSPYSNNDKNAYAEIERRMRELGVGKESPFYKYIADRIYFGYQLDKLFDIIKNNNGIIKDIMPSLVEELYNAKATNDSLINLRYRFFNTIRANGGMKNIGSLYDKNGELYTSRIGKVDSLNLKELEEISADVENYNLMGAQNSVQQMRETMLRIGKFDNNFFEQVIKHENYIPTQTRRMRPKKGFDRKKLIKRSLAIIAIGGAICGINRCVSTNDATIAIPNVGTGPVAIYEEMPQTDDTFTYVQENGEGVNIELPRETSEQSKEEEQIAITWQGTVDSTTESQGGAIKEVEDTRGPLEKLVDRLDDEEIEIIAQAICEGNDSIPNSVRDMFAVREFWDGEDRREYVSEFFKSIDNKRGKINPEIVPHLFSYQMASVAEAFLKHEIAESLNESGKYSTEIDMADIKFYYAYNTSDTVNKYDVMLLDSNGQTKEILSRTCYMKGTRLDKAIRDVGMLKRAIKIVSPFEYNTMIPQGTKDIIDFMKEYLEQDSEISLKGKALVIEQDDDFERDDF